MRQFLPPILMAAALAASGTANAIIVTLDTPNATVVRPTAGTLAVDFTGHIDLTPGFELAFFGTSSLRNDEGDFTFGAFPVSRF
jgi:hypothetical protein